jgi:hypothetical protein
MEMRTGHSRSLIQRGVVLVFDLDPSPLDLRSVEAGVKLPKTLLHALDQRQRFVFGQAGRRFSLLSVQRRSVSFLDPHL